MTTLDERTRSGNRLLAALSEEAWERLAPRMRSVSLEMRDTLFEPGEKVREVLFPLEGIVSLLTVVEGGDQVELATVGREGAVGLPSLLDSNISIWRAIVQVPGSALVIDLDPLAAEMEDDPDLREPLNRYSFALMGQIGQAVACNRLHPVGQRTARWLLFTHDRVGEDAFAMTHEFLSDMLGVRRASVTEVAGRLQEDGLIEYRRGRMRILDREGLEEVSCECYEAVRSLYDRVIPRPRS